MKKYFGLIDYEGFERSFVLKDKHYDYMLKFEEDQITLQDAVGRYVPMMYEDMLELYQIIGAELGIILDIARSDRAKQYLRDAS